MGRVTVTKTIDASQEAVFDVLADFEHAAERIPAILRLELLTDGPVGVGTRFSETRILFKKECTEEMEITGFSRPGGYRVESGSCGCHYTTDVRVRPEGQYTLVEMTMEYRAVSFLAKLMSPLAVLMRGPIVKCFEADLEALKGYVESGQPVLTQKP